MSTNGYIVSAIMSVLGVVYGVRIDGWWHFAFGRNEFWIPPHILIVASVLLAVVFAYKAYRTLSAEDQGRNALKFFALFMFGIVAVGVAWDELWHRFIGLETLDSVWLTLGPAHSLQKIFFLLAIGVLLPEVIRRREEIGVFWATLLIACGYIMVWESLVLPLKGFGGMQALGAAGEFFMGFILVGALLFSKRLIPGGSEKGSALIVAFAGLTLIFAGMPSAVAPNLRTVSSAPLPAWILATAILAAAFAVELLWPTLQKRLLLLGAAAGLGYGIALAPLAKIFLGFLGFPFSWDYVVQVVAFSALGGMMAGNLTMLVNIEALRRFSSGNGVRALAVASAIFIIGMSIIFYALTALGLVEYGI